MEFLIPLVHAKYGENTILFIKFWFIKIFFQDSTNITNQNDKHEVCIPCQVADLTS